MSRINVVTAETATDEQAELYAAITAKLGMVPNFLKVLANSPSALRAFLGLHGIADEGSLDPMTRERIALTVAEKNACEYCVSAHTAIGRKAGLSSAEVEANRAGGRAAFLLGYSFWVQLKSCKGAIVIDLGTECGHQQTYAHGACKLQ